MGSSAGSFLGISLSQEDIITRYTLPLSTAPYTRHTRLFGSHSHSSELQHVTIPRIINGAKPFYCCCFTETSHESPAGS